MAHSVKHLTLAQGMISRFMSLSHVSGSGLTPQSLEPASDSVSPSLSAPPLLVLSSLSLKNRNIKKIFLKVNSLDNTLDSILTAINNKQYVIV